jgi:hypothetical protein
MSIARRGRELGAPHRIDDEITEQTPSITTFDDAASIGVDANLHPYDSPFGHVDASRDFDAGQGLHAGRDEILRARGSAEDEQSQA